MYSKTSQKDRKLVLKTQLLLNVGQKYSKGSILQYFRPSLSYHLSIFLFCRFLIGHFIDVPQPLTNDLGSFYFKRLMQNA